MPRSWPDQAVAAVSLTFDGTTPKHGDIRRQLDKLGLQATFYAEPAALLADPANWREAVAGGHELGNHALLGACDDDGLIVRLSAEAIADEVDDCTALLMHDFGVREHSAAMPLVRTVADETGIPTIPGIISRSVVKLNEEALGEALRQRYSVIRTPLGRFNAPPVDLQDLRCCAVDGLDAVAVGLITQIAISQGDWVILSWGADPDIQAVVQIARWLRKQPVWTAPVMQVAMHLRESSPSPPTFQSL